MSSRRTYEIFVGESLPDLGLFLLENGQLVAGLDSGYTFELKVATLAGEVLLTKSAGIVGQAGADLPPLGTPNVVVQWEPTGELDQLAAGSYRAQLKITRASDNKVRIEQWLIVATAAL